MAPFRTSAQTPDVAARQRFSAGPAVLAGTLLAFGGLAFGYANIVIGCAVTTAGATVLAWDVARRRRCYVLVRSPDGSLVALDPLLARAVVREDELTLLKTNPLTTLALAAVAVGAAGGMGKLILEVIAHGVPAGAGNLIAALLVSIGLGGFAASSIYESVRWTAVRVPHRRITVFFRDAELRALAIGG